jgi:hypothetical protein
VRKRFVAIYSVLVVAIVLLAVFVPSCDGGGTIWVKATLCDVPWTGNVSYTLTGPGGSSISGTYVTTIYGSVNPGTWTCAYVSGGPAGAGVACGTYGAYLDSITPSAAQTVSGNNTITFTLNFELAQDAGIVFDTWTVDDDPVRVEHVVTVCQIIDAHFKQWVNGCEGYNVTLNETSWLKITQTGGPGGVMINVVNDDCGLNKTSPPESKMPPPVKLSQVATFNGTPVMPGMNIPLALNVSVDLDVETAWQLVKCLNYTKTINWFGISLKAGEHPCVLFELVVPGPGQYMFILQTSASVALVNNVDANLNNNSTGWSPQLTLMVNVP